MDTEPRTGFSTTHAVICACSRCRNAALHCKLCGRFVGADATEITNPVLAAANDPDGWTGSSMCPPGVGCQ